MTRLQKIVFSCLVLLLVVPALSPAIQRQRGYVRKTGDVLCLYHCDDYYLEPDPGSVTVILTGLNLEPFVGLHVEVIGWQVSCGSCPSLSVSTISYLTIDDVPGFSAMLPAEPALFQNYPNPFNPQTKISFRVASYGPVTLTIYNTLGEQVSTLVNGNMQPGTHEVSWDASGLSSGVYHYVLRTGGTTQTKSMLLLR